jgi:hypothetical protein
MPVTKPWTSQLVVVTATANLAQAQECISSWQAHASFCWPLCVVVNGTDHRALIQGEKVLISRHEKFLGSVPAFAEGVRMAAELDGVRYIAALHDDVEITEPGWDAKVISRFAKDSVGLVGFSGASGLGAGNIYKASYDPMQLARMGFISNMRDAELHGQRVTTARRVACCDGFAMVGRSKWWVHGATRHQKNVTPPWEYMLRKGVKHHAYDSWLGLLAARAGWETWYEPIACHHYGGRTAVGNRDYNQQENDQKHWETAHRAFYDDGRDLLPLRVS